MAETVEITDAGFAPEERLRAFRAAQDGAGAVVSFTGVVRADPGADALILSHYPGYTERVIAEQAAAAAARFGLTGALVVHRVGEMAPGEPVVLVATAAPHRREAFEAADLLMDHLKSAAPFWKKERGPAGERWIEPTARDTDDLRRWTADAR